MTTWPDVGFPGGEIPLSALLERHEALSPEAALLVLRDSLLALAAAHEHRAAHPDFRPEIVLVDRAGRTELTGFGAPARAGGPVPARAAVYRAPEQRGGGPAGRAANLYAATAVFFECLTGAPPSRERIRQFRGRQLPAATALGPAVEPLGRLMAWGMAGDPAGRPAGAGDFVAELDAMAFGLYGPDWDQRGRRELAERVAGTLMPGAAAAAGGGLLAGWLGAGRRVRYAGVAAVALLLALGATGSALALSGFFSSGPSHPGFSAGVGLGSSVGAAAGPSTAATGAGAGATPVFTADATVTPPATTSTCARPASFTVSGTVGSTAAGTVTYQWVYSSGKTGPVQTAKFSGAATQRVTGAAVASKTAGTGWAQLKLLTPKAGLSNQATYTLDCSTDPVTVSATAAVTPATSTVSCDAAPPAGTFTGTIRDTKAGTVTYHWELPSGNGPTQSLSFAAPGTQAVRPASVTASSDSTAEAGTLVVVSPAAVSSNTAAFSVACTQPAGGTTSPTASPTQSVPGTPQPTLSTTPGLAVQLVTNQVIPKTVTCGSAPPTFTQLASVTSTQTIPAETYHWVRPDGTTTAPATIRLNAGATSSTSDQFTPATDSFSGAETLVFTGPATGSWSVALALNCSAATGSPSPSPSGSASPLTLSTTPNGSSADVGTIGVPVSIPYTAQGGTGPYTWTATGLPPGLSVNPSTGTVSGTPTTFGEYGLDVTVTDSGSPAQSASGDEDFIIGYPPVQISTTALPSGTAGAAYPGVQFSAAGGDGGPYTWFVSAGTTLPAGLSLSASGVLSGTPATAGTFTVYVSVNDTQPSAGFADTQLTLTVNPG